MKSTPVRKHLHHVNFNLVVKSINAVLVTFHVVFLKINFKFNEKNQNIWEGKNFMMSFE